MPGRIADQLPPERRPGAKRCSNKKCEFYGQWLTGTMVRTKNGWWLCTGRGCHRSTDLTRSMRKVGASRWRTEAACH